MLLSELYAPGETLLRQIYLKKQDNENNIDRVLELALFQENENYQSSLIRKRDHKKEQSDILVDFLDYQKDQLIQQTSVDTQHIQIILHKFLPFESKRDCSVGKDLKLALRLLVKCLEPVIMQGLKIHEDLADLVRSQSKLLYLQVQSDSAREVCRRDLKNISLCDEKEGLQKIQSSIS